MNTIHISDIVVGMKFRNIYGEHYSTIAQVEAERGVIKSEQPYYGYAGVHHWFAIDRIQVQNEAGVYCYVDESKKAE